MRENAVKREFKIGWIGSVLIILTLLSGTLSGYLMYQEGKQFRGGDGIVAGDADGTINNVGKLGKDGMRETDKEIISIMMQCVN